MSPMRVDEHPSFYPFVVAGTPFTPSHAVVAAESLTMSRRLVNTRGRLGTRGRCVEDVRERIVIPDCG